MRNTDDDVLVHCEVRFPVNSDRARVADALDRIEAFERDDEEAEARWRWVVPGSPLRRARDAETVIGTASLGTTEMLKGMLALSVYSRQRAERGAHSWRRVWAASSGLR